MTFFTLIRNSLLADSGEVKPPGELVRYVLCKWRKKTANNSNSKDELSGNEPLRKEE